MTGFHLLCGTDGPPNSIGYMRELRNRLFNILIEEIRVWMFLHMEEDRRPGLDIMIYKWLKNGQTPIIHRSDGVRQMQSDLYTRLSKKARLI